LIKAGTGGSHSAYRGRINRRYLKTISEDQFAKRSR
jgi:hypothetical protein